MNSLLMKHRPSNVTPEKWEEQWEAAAPTLEPLAKVLVQLKEEAAKTKRSDFDCPNHYAKLAFEAGQIYALEQILTMMPKAVDVNK